MFFIVETHQVEVQTLVGAEVIHQPDIQNAEQGHSEPITVTLEAVLGHDLGQGDAGLSQSTGKQTPKPGTFQDIANTAARQKEIMVLLKIYWGDAREKICEAID
ncbi:hypothetical protein LOK49_LG12G00596 [Camellia lanceoleosa]|uniref:Uncharacterized protein n=1 Tax=Camellia lanceoleosa TaxID=1840588 RepID=A0ACC0FRI1_9ERIC|nr:hypothetical protein LOK49_LG12G00596 [Camellia lanceoleosa]